MKYPKEFRENLVRRILQDRISVKDLSKKHNLHPTTLYTWVRDARNGTMFGGRSRKSGGGLREKHSLLLEAKGKTEKSLGAWLREKGLHSDKLKLWEKEIGSALDSAGDKSREKELERKLKQVMRDLTIKEKALAEMTALVVLKKKVLSLLGEEELP